MKSGKIGSVLAAFEDNIAKNNEHPQEACSKSFLTTIACNTPVSKYRSSASNKKKFGRIEESVSRSSDLSSTAATVSDEESALSSVKLLQQSEKKRSLRKVKVVRSSAKKKEEPGAMRNNNALKSLIEKSSSDHQKLSFRSATSSNAIAQQEVQDAVVHTKSSAGARSVQKSSLDKIAATIKRVNSSNSLREAAQAATKSPKSTSSKISANKLEKLRKKLSDHVNQSPTRGHKIYEKSISSLPITSAVANPARQESFSSLPVFVSSTSSSKGIETTAQGSSTDRKLNVSEMAAIQFIEQSDHDPPFQSSTKSLKKEASMESVPMVNIQLESHEICLQPLDRWEGNTESVGSVHEIDMEYGPQEMDCRPIERSELLPKRTGSIARAARRSSVELCAARSMDATENSVVTVEEIDMEYGPQEMDRKPIDRGEALLKRTGSAAISLVTTETSGVDVQDVDMEYGPQEMDYKIIDRSESLPKRTGSIARAARRSSVELCGKVESFETHSVSGMTTISDDSTMGKTLETTSLSWPKNEICDQSAEIESPEVEASHRTNSSRIIGRQDDVQNMKDHACNPFPQSPTNIELTQKLQQLNRDDTENSEILEFGSISTGQISDEFVSKRKPISSFSSNNSLFTLDMNRRPKTPKSRGSTCSWEDDAHSFSTKETAPAVLLPRRDEVVGILRLRPTLRNTTRHVQFADQQPGGGRRMSLDSSHKNDSLPVRPRRSNNFHLDRLKDSREYSNYTSQLKEPLHFMSVMAATRIQAVVRCWIQWKSTRFVLLSRKLIRIEESRERDLAKIKHEKWKFIESIQSEIVEREHRLEAQVSLGEKLSDHLKRDSALVRDQTKKLKEYSQNLKKNNSHLDQSIRLHHENFATVNVMIELLREKSDILLASSKKYASRIDKVQEQLEHTSKQVEVEFHDKVRTRKAIKSILRLLKKRSSTIDKSFVDFLFQISNGGGEVDGSRHNSRTVSFDTVATDDFGKNAFDLLLNPHDNDMMSVYSDVTDFSHESGSEHRDKRQEHMNFSPQVNETSRSDISFKIEVLNKGRTKSRSNSFASYGNGGAQSTSHLNKSMNELDSVNGNSFASYSGPALANAEDSTKVGTRNSTMAVPPRRRASYHREDSADLTIGDFDTITEEVSLLEDESTDS